MLKKAIVGAGGFAREVAAAMGVNCPFFVDDIYQNEELNVFGLSEFDPNNYEVVVAIGDPIEREAMVKKLPYSTKYFTFVDPSARIFGVNVNIGEGSIVCAGSIITTSVTIGKHAHINLLSTIGHDTVIGDYFTCAPGSKISGNCNIADRVYLGTNSSIRQKIDIISDVIIGLNGGVVRNITEPGVYIGTPATKVV